MTPARSDDRRRPKPRKSHGRRGRGPGDATADDRRRAEPQQRPALWLAAAFAMATVLWTGVMLASLKWHFLDRFSVGTPDRRVGVDFFQVPRGYENLFHGNSIFLTELSDFGPYSTPYVLHPCVAIAVGSWAFWLGPWAGYCTFVAVSLGLLLLGARLLAFGPPRSTWRAFAFFAMICSVPVYYLLWAGQIHVFLVAAVALILAGLMRLEGEDLTPRRHVRWIQAGDARHCGPCCATTGIKPVNTLAACAKNWPARPRHSRNWCIRCVHRPAITRSA